MMRLTSELPLRLRSSTAMFGALTVLAAFQAVAAPAEEATSVFAAAVAKAQRRVVKIYGAKVGRTPGYATGVIVGPDGTILTASGTYLNGDRIRVVLPDGTLHVAVAERRSRTSQLTTLKIPAETPDYFDLSQQPALHKGQWVLVLSNIFKIADGVESLSATLGIVSLRTRLEAKRGTQPFPYEGQVLLIDTISSNPGGPGGALVTPECLLAGIIGPNLESRSSGTRLNYAIPVEVLQYFLQGKSPELADRAAVTKAKPFLGVRLFRFGGRRAPAYIDRVISGSPAASVGLRPDDVILAIGDERIKTVSHYDQVLQTLAPGEAIEITVKRDQELIRVNLTPRAE